MTASDQQRMPRFDDTHNLTADVIGQEADAVRTAAHPQCATPAAAQ